MTPTRFVIACFGRTGSNWLCQLLDSHPAILCHSEVFNPDAIWYALECRNGSHSLSSWTMAERDRDPAAFLAQVFEHNRGHDAVGVKVLNWQQPDLIDELAREPTVRKVFLRRENRVRAFLSQTRSELTDRWSHESYDGMRVRLEPEELLDYVEQYERFYAGLAAASADSPSQLVTYEGLLAGPGEIQRVVEFLGVQPIDAPLQARMAPQSHDRLRDAVVNFDELSAALAGTPLHAELHE